MSTPEAKASYRAFVQRYVKADQPSSDERNALEIERSRLKLLPDEAEAIVKEALKARSASVNAPATQLNSTNHSADSHEQSQPKSTDVAASQTGQSLNGDTSKTALNLAASATLLTPKDKNFAAETLLPPQQPEKYFADLQDYGQQFLRALREEGFNLGEETRDRLRKLAAQYKLVGSDVADIERKMLVELYLNSKPPAQATTPVPSATSIPSAVPVTVTPNPVEVEPKYDPQLLPLFEELEGSLKQVDLRTADIATFEILLKVLNRSDDWLDEESLRKFLPKSHDKRAVQEIDQLWRKYSKDHKLGFSSQLQLYGMDKIPSQPAALNKQPAENRRQASAFSKAVKWWINGLEFYKFYDQLDFSPDAPKGHLPALWFWRIPRQKVFQYGGLGLLAERGGCHIDSFLLPSFMCLLKNCDLNHGKKN